MTLIGWVVAVIFVCGMVVAGCIALANEDDDEDGFGGVRVTRTFSPDSQETRHPGS